jgi:hypothetical protein
MSTTVGSTSAEASTTTARSRLEPNRGRGRGRGTSHTGTSDGPSTSNPNGTLAARSSRGRGRERNARDDPPHIHRVHRGGGGGRRREFGAQLTESTPELTNSAELSGQPAAPQQHKRLQQTPKAKTKLAAVDAPIPVAQDLTTRLIESMCKSPYADCPICFNEIHPLQPTWSCVTSEETNRCCWTVFHNKCIFAWSKKSEWAEECAYNCEIYVLIVVLKASRKAEMRIEGEMRTVMGSGDAPAAKRSGLLLQALTGGRNWICNTYRLS